MTNVACHFTQECSKLQLQATRNMFMLVFTCVAKKMSTSCLAGFYGALLLLKNLREVEKCVFIYTLFATALHHRLIQSIFYVRVYTYAKKLTKLCLKVAQMIFS